MKKTRTTKQLLRVLAKGVRKYLQEDSVLFGGMCMILVDMEEDGMVTGEEYLIIQRYLMANTPEGKPGWWFPRGKKEPRLKWINEQIKKL